MVEVEPQYVTSITPSGIEVFYQWEPKRLYRVRYGNPNHLLPSDDPLHEWVEVPSVTTVLDVLDKPGLPWWGMGIGIEGVSILLAMNVLQVSEISGQKVLAYRHPELGLVVAGKDEITELLTKHKLTTNHVRDKAGDRGQAVHDALEAWASEGVMPDPSIFSPNEQGYVAGLRAFFDHVYTATPEASEVMVGSLEHGFAGRYDLRIKTSQEHYVVYKRTPVKGAQYAKIPAGRFLIDLKTSKGVYPKHSRQLEAYEQASVECGYEPTDARGILHVGPDGTYEFVRSTAEFEDFRVVLEVWKSEQRMKARKR